VTSDGCFNGKSEAGTAPASKETTANVQPAATANNFASMEKLPLDLTASEETIVFPANQGKQPN
jgi:hypothetical protein